MNLPYADLARQTARALAEAHPKLAMEVEATLVKEGATEAPTKFLDPVSLGALVVSVASLAWTIYHDLKKDGQKPSREVVARQIRVRLGEVRDLSTERRDQMIQIVVAELDGERRS